MEIDAAIRRLRAFARDHALFNPSDRVLVAASGGMDSMCMLHLLHVGGQSVEVAHVNYGLRAEASDADADLVRQYCTLHQLTYHEYNADSTLLKNTGSLQKAAREMRYTWFEQLTRDRELGCIATAHHLDDSIETFLINLIRGTGIHGLAGIPVRRDNIVRPMLGFMRSEIEAIVELNQIPFRHDATNAGDDYLRNRVRHVLLPDLDQIAPQYRMRMRKNMDRLRGQSELLTSFLDRLVSDIVKETDSGYALGLVTLQMYPAPGLILYHLAGPLGFTEHQCTELINYQHQTGCHYLSDTHEMTLDRERIVITAIQNSFQEPVEIAPGQSVHIPAGVLRINQVDQSVFDDDPNIEFIDAQKCGPLFELRPWTAGDRFHPIGADGRQKVKDFLTNQKIARPVKRNTLVLTNQDNIVWVVGHRVDERFKVTGATRHLLELRWRPTPLSST